MKNIKTFEGFFDFFKKKKKLGPVKLSDIRDCLLDLTDDDRILNSIEDEAFLIDFSRPECTNISAGGFNEHYQTEWVDLNYTWEVYKAAIDTDWESLPTVRELEVRFGEEESSGLINRYKNFSMNENAEEIDSIFKALGMRATRNIVKSGVRHLTYSKWLEDVDFDIFLDGDSIKVNNKSINMTELKDIIKSEFYDDIADELEYYLDLKQKGVRKADSNIKKIAKIFGISDIEDFIYR